MKYIRITFLFLLSLPLQAQVSLVSLKQGLQINFNKVIRLANGVGLQSTATNVVVNSSIKNGVVILKLSPSVKIGASDFAGVFFDAIPHLKQGVTIWRYKPWNS
ncbi:MAG: hypothetical protein ABIN97_12840, partial [Ginsengibacter sp.]